MTLAILIMTALACGLVGVFLVLRNLAMVADAISHSVLLGIVLAFFLTHDLSSPLLIAGAALFGVFTVYCIELLIKTGLIKEDAAVGIVFTFFFALAVILLTKFARYAHIDTDCVLMGEVIFAGLNTVNVMGIMLPKALVVMSTVFIIDLAFITVFYKELKISTFDPQFAVISGFSSGFLHYGLMTLVSLTTVAAFDAVGAILVISFLITPAGSAYLITKNLRNTILITFLYGILNSVSGYYLGMYFNVSISGMCATVSLITLLLTFMFHKNGIITTLIMRKKRYARFKSEILVMHIANHMNTPEIKEELGFKTIHEHLNWRPADFNKHVQPLLNRGLVLKDEKAGVYILSESGLALNEKLLGLYGLT